MDILQTILANKAEIIQVITAVVTVATVIVKLTPTLKDDNILLPIVKFLSKYIALNTITPEDRPE